MMGRFMNSQLFTKKNDLGSKAFTLIELMIAISLSLLIAAVVGKILVSSMKSSSSTTQKTYAQKNARIALRQITKDLTDAEKVDQPGVGSEDSSLLIDGLTQKNKQMQAIAGGSLIFKPADEINQAWKQGKPVIIYVNGTSQQGGYRVNYTQGTITFIPPVPAGTITADFSYDLSLTYSKDGSDLIRTLDGQSRTIANGLTDIKFARTSKNQFKVNMDFKDYSLSSSLDISTGTYITDESSLIPKETPVPALNSLYFSGPLDGWIVGGGGRIWKYGNSAWYASPTNESLNKVTFADSSVGAAVGSNGTILRYFDGAWGLDPSVSNNLLGLIVKDSNNIIAVGSNGVEGTTFNFNGTNWLNNIDSSGTMPLNNISGHFKNIYAVANGGKFYKIRSSNNSWQEINDFGSSNLDASNVVSTSDQSNYFVWIAGDNGTLWRYNNDDDSFANYTDPANGDLNSVSFFDENDGFSVGGNGLILRYDSDLDQWMVIPSGTTETLNDVFMYAKDEGYIVGDNGTLLKIETVKE